MEQFNDDFYDNLSKIDVPFDEYFNALQGKSIRVNYMTNEMYIIGENQSHRGTVSLGRSAKDAGLEITKLLNRDSKIGEFSYGVLLNGFEKKDWLFAVKVVAIL
jgi:hypothetical protein